MTYQCGFSTPSIEKKFRKAITDIPSVKIQDKIMQVLERLQDNPRPFGTKFFKQLKPPVEFQELTANYRIRIGDYRVLYDVDDKKKFIWLIALRKRGEGTYKLL